MNYGSGCNMFVTVGALWISLHLVKALLTEGAVIARLSQDTARNLFALCAQL